MKHKQGLMQSIHHQVADEASLMRIFRFIIFVLFVVILLTASALVKQVERRHETYRALQSLKEELRKLQIEEQRLLIEQQTFSATPKVSAQAANQLNMRLPSKEERKVIAVPTPPKMESQP